MCQVGDRDKHIQAFASWWGKCGIGARWRVQVERQVFRQSLAVEDMIDKLAILLWHTDGVVTQLWILAVEAQIEQKAAHRVAVVLQPFVERLRLLLFGKQMEIGRGYVAIGNDSLG